MNPTKSHFEVRALLGLALGFTALFSSFAFATPTRSVPNLAPKANHEYSDSDSMRNQMLQGTLTPPAEKQGDTSFRFTCTDSNGSTIDKTDPGYEDCIAQNQRRPGNQPLPGAQVPATTQPGAFGKEQKNSVGFKIGE